MNANHFLHLAVLTSPGAAATVTYGDALNDRALIQGLFVPEPGMAALSLLAISGLLRRRR